MAVSYTHLDVYKRQVLDCINHFKIEVNDVLVVVDDINLALSKIRIRKSGGDGGHNGLYSIIYHLAVSYTHLDVYKRQPLLSLDFFSKMVHPVKKYSHNLYHRSPQASE